jgi:hypothetical protein
MKLTDITKWADSEARTISVLSDVCSVPCNLKVCRFVPTPHDSMYIGWMDGRVKKFKETIPFRIVNMSNTINDMKEYIDTHVFEAMEIIPKDADPVIKETYSFARKHMERHRVSPKGLYYCHVPQIL